MLKALELAGFKSFADKTRFEFPAGITVVVGPNGSGKSNVVDSIKWVLGEQSVKSLRGKEMADVIFNGSGARRGMNAAEVTLTFNNADHSLALDTPEVHITRRVYRSGEGEYLINRSPCRLRDIRDLLTGTGMGTQAYSVIEQGKVDVLLQSSPRDRRVIFEEAAGISRFKLRKLEALRRLERVDQNLLRLSDIIEEVDGRLRTVRAQAGKARRYKEYTDRLQELRTQVGLVDWRRLTQRLTEFEKEVGSLAAERDSLAATAEASEARLLDTDGRIGGLNEAIRQAEGRIAANRERIAGQESTIQHERSHGRELEDEIARCRRQLLDLGTRADDLEQEFHGTTRAVREAEEQQRGIAQQVTEGERALTEVMARLDRLRGEHEQRRTAQLEQMRQASGLASETSVLESQATAAEAVRQRSRDRIAELDRQLVALAADLDRLRQARRVGTAGRRAGGPAGRRQAGPRPIAAGIGRPARRTGRLGAAPQRGGGTGRRARRTRTPPRGAQRGGEGSAGPRRQPAERALPRRLRDGGRPVLGERRGGAAGGRGLGPGGPARRGRGQQGTVGSLAGAVAAFHRPRGFLMARRPVAGDAAGGSRFAGPARSAGPRRPLRRDRAALRRPGAAAAGTDLDRRETQPRPRSGPLGRRGLSFVTLAGELLEADGTLTVGPRQLAAGLISRRSQLRALKSQLGELEGKIGEGRTALAGLQQRIAQQQQRLERCEAEHRQALDALGEQRLKISAAEERRAQFDQQREMLEGEFRAAEEQHETSLGRLAEARQRRAQLDAALAEMEGRLAGLEEQIVALEGQRQARNRETTETKVELAKSEERLRSLHARLRQVEEGRQERVRAIADGQGQLADCLRRAETSGWSILRAETEIAELYLRKESLSGETVEHVNQRELLQQQRADLTAEAQRLRGKVRKIEERLHVQDLAANQVRVERSALVQRLHEDYGIDLAAADGEAADPQQQHEREAVQEEIDELRRKIDAIGSVNLEALEELDTLEVRYKTLSEQHQDLAAAKAALEKIIDKINTDSRRLFAETLQTVRGHFQQLFRDLFGGGHGDIVLEEGVDILESGMEIVARPPGKEPRSISLLSGGEKTLTCVALLLAIFRSRPSPFCVLDEVDAALDEANIDRFTKVLHDFLAWTQFIIVTHSKKTMTCADTIYGVTMQESGVSKQVSVRFEDVSEDGQIRPERPADADSQSQAA